MDLLWIRYFHGIVGERLADLVCVTDTNKRFIPESVIRVQNLSTHPELILIRCQHLSLCTQTKEHEAAFLT